MKARHLILTSMLSATSSLLAQDQSQNQDAIIKEALKATPAGFTDLVPRRSFPSPVIKRAPGTAHRLQPTPMNFGIPTSALTDSAEEPITELDSILKAHHEENEAFIRRLSKVLQSPQ